MIGEPNHHSSTYPTRMVSSHLLCHSTLSAKQIRRMHIDGPRLSSCHGRVIILELVEAGSAETYRQWLHFLNNPEVAKVLLIVLGRCHSLR